MLREQSSDLKPAGGQHVCEGDTAVFGGRYNAGPLCVHAENATWMCHQHEEGVTIMSYHPASLRDATHQYAARTQLTSMRCELCDAAGAASLRRLLQVPQAQ